MAQSNQRWEAARHFFYKTLTASHPAEPRVINVDKNAAYTKVLKEIKAEGIVPEPCELRQVKYLNTLIEQDHSFIKRLTKPGMVFFSFETAQRTLQGEEVMHMMRKGQATGGKKRDSANQATFIAEMFGVAM